MITVTRAIYEGEYRIRIAFSTGEEGVVDLQDVISRYPVAQPLLDQEQFRRFFLDDWPTLAWPCGFDLAPEMLYERATGKPPSWLQPPNVHPPEVEMPLAKGRTDHEYP